MDLRVEALALDERLEIRTGSPAVIVPLRTSVVDAVVRGERLLLDGTHFGVVPEAARLALAARSPGARVLMASAHPPLLEKTVAEYRRLRMDGTRFRSWLATPQLVPRTVWVYYLLRDRDDGADRASLVQKHSPHVQRALAYVEAHLFESPSIAAVARAAGASESTLLRAFKREVGCTPSAYWRMLRLDEALVLLESGRHSVTEVALHVGDENASAFAHAFQRRFGRPPSGLVPR